MGRAIRGSTQFHYRLDNLKGVNASDGSTYHKFGLSIRKGVIVTTIKALQHRLLSENGQHAYHDFS